MWRGEPFVPLRATIWVSHFGPVSLSFPCLSWDNMEATALIARACSRPAPPREILLFPAIPEELSRGARAAVDGLATQLPLETETSPTSVCQAATRPLKIAALPPSPHPPCAGQAAGHSQRPCGLTWPPGRDWAPWEGRAMPGRDSCCCPATFCANVIFSELAVSPTK